MRRCTLLGILVLTATSAFASQEVPPIRIIDAEAAKSCKFIDMVSGARLGMGASKTMNAARNAAAKKAAKRGANAMVVKDMQMQGSGAMVIGDAYSCTY